MDKRIIIFLSIITLFVVVRIILFYSNQKEYVDGEIIDVTTNLVTQPKLYGNYQTFSIELSKGESIFVKTKPEVVLNYADLIHVVGNVKYTVLKNKNKVLALDYPKIEQIETGSMGILAVVNRLRQNITAVFMAFLPKDLAGLMLGIVVGAKTNMSSQFINNLRLSGVMHVVAASGMNVAMVGGFFFYSFSYFLKRQAAVIISIMAIIFYAILAGLEPSIIRASIMGIILFSSQILGRQNYTIYSLCITLLVMLFIWPQFLFDVGFQLSFISTLGILYIPSLIGVIRDFISEDLITTTSAQIASLPIIFLNFGTYSIWSILVNFLVLWTIPPLMILGGLAAILGLIYAPLAKFILVLAHPLLAFFEAVVNYFAGLKANITIDSFPITLCIGYYLILLSVIIYLKKRSSVNHI